MSNIEKIKAEIERQLEYFKGKEDDAWDDCDKYTDEDAQWYQGHWKMCSRLLDFIDSLPEEKLSEDLEEAAEQYTQEMLESWKFDSTGIRPIREPFIAGAEWQKQRDAELIEIAYNDGITIGKTKQKEQMMKDAVEIITVQRSLTEPEFVKQRVIFLKED